MVWYSHLYKNYPQFAMIHTQLHPQEKTLHMDITRWSISKSNWLYSLQPKMENLYTVRKNKNRSWLWLRAWTPYWQIQTEEMGIPDHLTCLLRNLYASQEGTVRTGHGTIDWFQIGKGVHQGCILSPCLFNLYVQYIMRNSELEEAKAGIKIAWRNTSNLRYADDTTLWQKVKRNRRASW